MNSTHDDVDDDVENDDSDDVGDIICDIPCFCWFDHKELGSRQNYGEIDQRIMLQHKWKVAIKEALVYWILKCYLHV